MTFVFCYLALCAIIHVLTTGLHIGGNDRDSGVKALACFITAILEIVCAVIIFRNLS